MRVLFVVQRYGADIAGGSEQCCRAFAERLAARGHHVEVATSCAREYTDWANVFDPGEDVVNGVRVHRFPIDRQRDGDVFKDLDARVVWGAGATSWRDQEAWIDEVGPRTTALPDYLYSRASDFDLMAFFTYLYYPTVRGLPAVAGRTATLLQPTAHLEPQLSVPLFNQLFRLPDGMAFLTDEESALVTSRFGHRPSEAIVGVGCDLDVEGDGDRFRQRHRLGNDPFLLSIGRVDVWKGTLEAFDYFAAFKDRNPSNLRLVIVGDRIMDVPEHPDVMLTGFLDETEKADAIAACTAFVQPSYFESFSMALSEAWALRKPALVQGRCDVLSGQARRAGGALRYDGFAEFEAAVQILLDNPALCDQLGNDGRDYVARTYAWDVVMDSYEDLLERTVTAFANR